MLYSALYSHMEPRAAEPFLLLLAILVLLPVSGDPLSRIPASRAALWPMSAGQRAGLRLGAIALAPALWILAFGAVLWKTRRPELGLFLIFAAGLVQVVAPAFRTGRRRAQPRLRIGPLLIRANLRQIVSTLDFWLALAIATGGAAYRIFDAHADPDAFGVLSIVVALALSSYAQTLFGLDAAGSGTTRYRLLPLAGWRVLLAKDAALMAVLLCLCAPLRIAPGATFGLTALAIGHFPSVRRPAPMERRRFAGTSISMALIQGIPAFILGIAEIQEGAALLAAAVAYAASLAVSGKLFLKAES